MVTYKDILKMVESNPNGLFVAVIYPKKGSHEWLPVDKEEFIRQLRLISYPDKSEYPCSFEVDSDGDMFIHPNGNSELTIHPNWKGGI